MVDALVYVYGLEALTEDSRGALSTCGELDSLHALKELDVAGQHTLHRLLVRFE